MLTEVRVNNKLVRLVAFLAADTLLRVLMYIYIYIYISLVASVITLLDDVETMLVIIGILVDVDDKVVVNISGY